MGYSAATAAMDVLESFKSDGEGKNAWTYGNARYFYEVGRENWDGAVTGSIYRFEGDRARKVGGFRINPNGAIARAPYGMGHRLDMQRANASFVTSLSPREKWARACDFDGIDPASMFVVFSANNPYV